MSYLGDFVGTETIPIVFDTFDSNGASVTMTGLATTDIEIYKGSSVVQRASDSGYTLIDTDGIDIDGATGIHGFTVDLSDNTDAGFYATGNDFYIVVNAVTIDSQTVRFIAARFSIQNRTDSLILSTVGNIASGTASISTVAESYTLTTGTQSSGLYTDTETRDGTDHQHTDAAGAMELYYQFDVGGNGVGSEIDMYGYLSGGNDSLQVDAYDWAGAAYDQVDTLDGGAASDSEHKYNLLARHTGTGANLGKVRLRFYAASGLSSATLSVDQITCSYAVVAQSVGYDGGQVWIDTADGTAGTESYVNGVADNPVLTLADAKTIASNIGLHKYNASNESTITLASATTNEEYSGIGWTLALGGQDVSGSTFIGANSVTGTCTSPTGESHFIECEFGNASVGNGHYKKCGFDGTLTLVAATDYFMVDCYSQVAGSGSPTIDMGAAVGASNLSVRRWAGGLTLNNLASGDIVTLDGTFGTVTLNGADATVELRGIAKAVTNNLTGSPSVSDDTIKATDISAILTDTASLGITKNTAFSNFEFLMVDATDTATPETGLTVTGQRSIDGAAFAAVSGSIAEVGSGIYQFDALAADTNGDVITWKFAATGAADRFVTFKTRA